MYFEESPQDFDDYQILGHYSVDGEEEMFYDERMKKYLYTPGPYEYQHYDLNTGADRAVRNDYSHAKKFHRLLRYIVDHNDTIGPMLQASSERTPVFVFTGSILTTFLKSTLDTFGLKLMVTKYKGVIYILERDNVWPENSPSPNYWTWMRKFRQLMTSSSPGLAPHTDEPVDHHEEFNIVCQSNWRNKKFLFSADITAEDPDQKSSSKFVSIKCCHDATYPAEKKYGLSWWAENIYLGIPKIILGFRTFPGKLKRITSIFTEDLPAIGKETWNPERCKLVCNQYFNGIKADVEKEYPAVYDVRIHFPNNVFEVSQTEEDASILPTWFTQVI